MKKQSNPDPRMIPFREKMDELGYSYDTIVNFCSGIRIYLTAGQPLDIEEAKRFFQTEEGKSIRSTYQNGVIKFIEYVNGMPVKRNSHKPVGGRRTKFTGCNEDCFNCKYSDCIMPENYCTSIPYEKWTGYVTREGKNDSNY